MQLSKKKTELSKLLSEPREKGQSIGFVPTMGALHSGHLSLIELATEQCQKVVVSIFVNPTQFDVSSDLEQYPRTLEKDLSLLEDKFPEAIVFAPTPEEVYGKKVFRRAYDFGVLSNYMEGQHRVGHFDGVGTVLELLFDMVRPQKAFFGEKDYQQLLIVKKLASLTEQNVEIIGCPIAREDNGLARSSRNERLSAAQRKEAAFIYQTLQHVKTCFGTKNADEIILWIESQFATHPFLKLEYFEIANAQTLAPIQENTNNGNYRAFIAAYAGEIRLIDNIALN